MKKIISLITALLLIISCTGCVPSQIVHQTPMQSTEVAVGKEEIELNKQFFIKHFEMEDKSALSAAEILEKIGCTEITEKPEINIEEMSAILTDKTGKKYTIIFNPDQTIKEITLEGTPKYKK